MRTGLADPEDNWTDTIHRALDALPVDTWDEHEWGEDSDLTFDTCGLENPDICDSCQ